MRSTGQPGGPFVDEPFCDFCGVAFKRKGRALYCCKDCSRQASRARRYGISPAELRELELERRDCCHICGGSEKASRPARLAVDHDHVTGQIRGLLCSHCNRALGFLNDDPALLRTAADYIERHRSEPVQLRLA